MVRSPKSRAAFLGGMGLVLALVGALWLGWGRGEGGFEERVDPGVASEPSGPHAEATREALLPLPPMRPETRDAVVAQEMAPEEHVELLVRTCENYSRAAPPVPDVPFELGLGSGFGPGGRALLAGTTDEQGAATVSLPRRMLVDESEESLWIRVVKPGFLRLLRAFDLPDPALREIQLVVQPGLSLVGRVLGQAGAPLHAEVVVGAWFPDPSLGFRRGEWEHTNREGWFELSLRREGAVRLLAEDRSEGSGVRDLVIDFFDPPPQPVEVALSGPGVLRGRVLESGGLPAAGLSMNARLASLEAPDPDRAEWSRALASERLAGGGHCHGGGETDLDGRFEFFGLREGPYVIHGGTGGEAVRLTPSPVFANGQELLLVHERPNLVLRVRDEDGRLWESVPGYVGFRQLDTNAWPEWPRARVLELGTPLLPSGVPEELEGKSLAGALAFEVRPGRSYLVGLYGGSESWRPIRVDVTSGGRTEVELHARPSRLGTLVVSAADGTRALRDGIAVRIEDPEGGFPLLSRIDFADTRWPQAFTLPEGLWRLVVEGRPLLDRQHGLLVEKSAHGRFETLVRVRADERTEVHAVLPAGARLRVAVSGTPCAEGAVPSEQAWLGPGGVALTVGDPTHWPMRVAFEGSMPLNASELRSRLPLGTEAVSEVLPAGRWTLVGRLADGRTARTEVVLSDGRTTEAALEFPP